MTTIERIRQYLYEKGLTLKDFSEITGCSTNVLSKSKWYIRHSTLDKLCEAFGEPISTFCTDTVAQKLVRLRNSAKLSVTDLAKLLDWHTSTIYYHESGKYTPTVAFLKQYAKLYEVPSQSLCYTYSPPMNRKVDRDKVGTSNQQVQSVSHTSQNKPHTIISKISNYITCGKCNHKYDVLDIAKIDANELYCMYCGTILMDNKKEFISNLKSELIEYANKL